MRHVAAKFVPQLLTDALLIHEFFMKHEVTVVPQPPYSPDLACVLFLVPEVETITKRSLISGGRRNRRKFTTGHSCYPAKHVPGRTPELEKTLGVVYQEGRRVL
jgi:hypothetical protein